MNLKQSFYNIEVKKLNNGETLLYNTLSSAFGVLSKKDENIYYNIENIDKDSINDEEKLKLLTTMEENGFIVNSSIDEKKRLDLYGRMARYNMRNLRLTIAPTLDCNMACPYCYEDKKKIRMNSETKEALLNFVQQYIDANSVKHFSVTWYGGEPLLEKETIYELSRAFIEICGEKNIKYVSDIITNGILLDADTAYMLRNECNIRSAQITIDGLEEAHNKRRIMKDSSNSFKTIIENIESVKDIITISVRMNVDKTNIDEAEKLLNYLLEEKQWGNKISLYFAPVQKQTDACKANVNSCYTSKEFGEIDSQLLRILNSKGNNNNIIRNQFPKSTMMFCTAVSPASFVIDPLGDLYNCWNTIGIKGKCIGSVFNGSSLNEEYLKWLCLDLPEECRNCNMLPLCQGGCPYQRIQNGNKAICTHKTISFKENLLITYENYIKSKNNQQVQFC